MSNHAKYKLKLNVEAEGLLNKIALALQSRGLKKPDFGLMLSDILLSSDKKVIDSYVHELTPYEWKVDKASMLNSEIRKSINDLVNTQTFGLDFQEDE